MATSITTHYSPIAASTPDWIGAIAEAVTAVSVILLIWQIVVSRSTAKAERTREFQERYLSDEFSISVRRTIACMRTEGAGGCVAVVEAWSNRGNAGEQVLPRPDGDDKAAVHDVEKTLGLFEAMGTAYNLRQLDKRVIQRSFAIPSVQVFTTIWWLICWQREGRLAGEKENQRVESIYAEFEAMCKDLRTTNPSLAHDPRLQVCASVRALCLPEGHGEKLEDDDAWAASRRLSAAISELIRSAESPHDTAVAMEGMAAELAGVEATADSADSGASPSQQPPAETGTRRWQLILIPPTIDQTCDASWASRRAAAKALEDALCRASEWTSLEAVVELVENRQPGGSAASTRPAATASRSAS